MFRIAMLCAAVMAGAVTAPAPAQADGDPAKGKTVFRKCAVCHSLNAGTHSIGPNLRGVVGRKAGTLEGFRFSRAMRESGLTWTPEMLDTYLQKPRELVGGSRMSFAGLRSAQERADLIAFLKTLR